MMNEATHFAVVLERISRKVLHQLREIPDPILNWTLPIPACDSLFAFATQLIELNEFWIRTIVGGQQREQDTLLVELYAHGEQTYLIARYEQWLVTMHEILDCIPDTMMNMVIVLPMLYRKAFESGPITVHDCLLYVVEQSAVLQGRIELLCQLYADGERFHQEILSQEEDEWSTLNNEQDANAGVVYSTRFTVPSHQTV